MAPAATSGARLRQERWRLRLTEAAMALRVGISKGALLALERDEMPFRGALLTALQRIGVDLLYVITGERHDGETPLLQATVEAICRTHLTFLAPIDRIQMLTKLLQQELDA